jgi:hypothetical protein
MKQTNPQLAQTIVGALFKDIKDRQGLRQGWEGIDGNIQDEILKTLLLTTKRILDDNK